LNNPVIDVTLEDVAALTSHCVIAANEVIDLDKSITQAELYQHATSSSTWVALKFLDQLKLTLPGFDYQLKHTDDGYPKGIVWMTPE
jgi:hypothetical protein